MASDIERGMKGRIVLPVIALLMLAACDPGPTRTSEPGVVEKAQRGEVVQIAKAPDGTVLWGVMHGSRYVYFAASGTQETHNCGKGCTRTQNTPTIYGSN